MAGTSRRPPDEYSFVIDHLNSHLLEVRVTHAELDAAKSEFTRRVTATALLPFAIALALLTGPLLDRRARASRPMHFWLWSLVASAFVLAATAELAYIERLFALGSAPMLATWGLGALGLVALIPLSWWRKPHHVRRAAATPARFAIDQLGAGAIAAVIMLLTLQQLSAMLGPDALGLWQYPFFPFNLDDMLRMAGILLVQTSLYWAMAATLGDGRRALAAINWRNRPLALVSALLWLGIRADRGVVRPRAAHRLRGARRGDTPERPRDSAVRAVCHGAETPCSPHDTSDRGSPCCSWACSHPRCSSIPSRTSTRRERERHLVEWEYSPETKSLPEQLLEEMTQAERDVDRLPSLLVAANAPPATGTTVPTQEAFAVWNKTILSSARVTSAIELYDAARVITSRFALNVPQFDSIRSSAQVERAATGRRTAKSCPPAPRSASGFTPRRACAMRPACPAAGS